MKIKVSSGFTGVIATGSYENARPAFTAEVEYELPEALSPESKETIDRDLTSLYEICYKKFKAVEDQMIVERIQNEREDIRFYEGPNGEKWPSVTSIIGFDADFFVDKEDLGQYASQGNITHLRVWECIKTGIWKEAKDIPDCWTDIVILTKGKLQLPVNVGNFPSFLEKNPIKNLKNSFPSYNEEYKYGGTPDFEGVYNNLGTLCDVKRTIEKTKVMMQLAAYSKMKGYEHIKQLMAIELNDKTQQGWSKPLVDNRIDEYFKMFLEKRKAFHKRYGL